MRISKDLQQNNGIINTIRNINKINPSHNINLTSIQYPEKNKTIILQKTSPNNNIPIKVKLVKSNQTHNMNQTQLNYSQYNKLQTSPQKKTPIDQIYNDQTSKIKNKNKLFNSGSKLLDEDLNLNNNHNNINQTEINKLRHSLIYAKEKQAQIEKEEQENQNFSKNGRKYISMSPKLTLRFKEENEEGKFELRNKINRGFVIQKNPSSNENNENDNDNKTTEGAPGKHEHKIRNLLSKNFPYNKPKPTNKLGSSYSILKKKSGEENKTKSLINSVNKNQLSGETAKSNNQYYHDDAMSVTSFNNINNMNNNMMINSPRTTASFMTEIDNNNNFIRNTQQNRYYKISMSPNKNNNMNRTSYNYYNSNNNNKNYITNNEIRYNNNLNNNINNNINNSYNNINYNNTNNLKTNLDIKLEDLIMIEERLNDICISLNNSNNANDVGASNECIEFFVFYFHSSLTYKFPLLFNENKRILIQSAINLKLFTIVMTYHLSMNLNMLSDILLYLKNIYSLLKLNLYLFIKKLQIFYGEAYVLQNEMYFKTFNYLLSRNGYNNMNENEIVDLIQNNCYKIVQSLSEIINYYESVGNNYYLDFLELFNTISKLTEKEINNYFYNYLYASRAGGQPARPRMEYRPLPARMRNNLRNNFYINNQTINNYNNININTLNNLNDINNINKNVNMNNAMNNKILKNNNELYEYQKNKISPPFLKEPCSKKYTLVLDINDTLLNIQYGDKNNGQVNLRPGLFSFLGAIKPYYELVSFTTETKEYSDIILKEIEKNRKYFDYNLYKDHTTLYGNKFIKDLNKLGRDIRKIIIIDDDPSNFILNPENGIQISPYLGDSTKDDTTLFELKKLLILFHRTGGDDIRKAIKSYEKDIKEKISLNYSKKF